MSGITRIGVIGDLHGSWDDWDTRYFNASDYELLLFTGDLGSGTADNGVRIARSLGRIEKPALVMPGNNDAHQIPKLAAELGHQRGLSALRLVGALFGTSPPGKSAGQVHLCGYSRHRYELAARTLTVIAARPYAMGNGELSFPPQLATGFQVSSPRDSQNRLRALVDQAPDGDLIFLAHNGPRGLGTGATDLWGADFLPGAGDWGDDDLADAISYARTRGKRVLSVLAGHMHSPTRGGAARGWQVARDGTLYVNPARVPRIWEDATGKYRHHAVLELGDEGVSVREVIVKEG
ncbi:MAG: hypothetical protein RLZZ450_5050 [Pseudomonadota bacterium]